jgi:hypothetical protein
MQVPLGNPTSSGLREGCLVHTHIQKRVGMETDCLSMLLWLIAGGALQTAAHWTRTRQQAQGERKWQHRRPIVLASNDRLSIGSRASWYWYLSGRWWGDAGLEARCRRHEPGAPESGILRARMRRTAASGGPHTHVEFAALPYRGRVVPGFALAYRTARSIHSSASTSPCQRHLKSVSQISYQPIPLRLPSTRSLHDQSNKRGHITCEHQSSLANHRQGKPLSFSSGRVWGSCASVAGTATNRTPRLSRLPTWQRQIVGRVD